MSFARAIRRGFFLKARLGVNGTQKASRSFGTDATGRVASAIELLLRAGAGRRASRRPSYQPMAACGMPRRESPQQGRVRSFLARSKIEVLDRPKRIHQLEQRCKNNLNKKSATNHCK